MKFVHTADIHLGVRPDAGSACEKTRHREIWESLERLIDRCEEEQTDLLLIAGDLFHRQPLLRELRDVSAIFSRLTHTQVVLSAGNHDYIKKDSYYRTFEWPEHVHMILSGELACVDLAEIDTAVYGFSYYSKELREKPYEQKSGFSGRGTEILMIHGGDEKHVPVRKEEIEALGYSYVALGHIHKPQVVLPDRMAWCGSLEPTDRNDTGHHGYISGEIREGVCHIQFVPFARREYVHASVQVDSGMSGYELKEKIRKFIGQRGSENIYRIILHGYHDPDVCFDLSSFDTYGNIIEITDATKPAYNYEKILRDNRDNIVGKLIEQWKDCEENSVEYRAMCEGVRALMETRRG